MTIRMRLLWPAGWDLVFNEVVIVLMACIVVCLSCICFFVGRWCPKCKREPAKNLKIQLDQILGCIVEESDNSSHFLGIDRKYWKRAYGCDKIVLGDFPKASVHTTDHNVLIHKAAGMDYSHENLMKEETIIGLTDNREHTINAATAFRVDVNAKGTAISGSANGQINKLLGEGHAELRFNYSLPMMCVRLREEEATRTMCCREPFITAVILGVKCEGSLTVANEKETFEFGGSVGCNGNLSEGKLSANAGLGGSSRQGPFMEMTSVTQEGGPTINLKKMSGRSIGSSLHYLKTEWADRVRKQPQHWKIIALDVHVPTAMSQTTVANMGVPHLVVLGPMGAGKSTLLNAVFGGRKLASGQPYFETSDKAKACTQTANSEMEEVDYVHERLNLRVTDMPGFCDNTKYTDKNEKNMRDLVKYLRDKNACVAHSIVLVHNFNNPRFDESTRKCLELLDAEFGDQFWDFLSVVFTRFELPRGTDEDQVFAQAQETMRKKSEDWRKVLYAHFDAARKWGEGCNMFFYVDSLSILRSFDDIEAQKQLTHGSQAGQGLHWEMSKNHTKQQIDKLLKVCKNRAEIDKGINFATGKKERTPSPRRGQRDRSSLNYGSKNTAMGDASKVAEPSDRGNQEHVLAGGIEESVPLVDFSKDSSDNSHTMLDWSKTPAQMIGRTAHVPGTLELGSSADIPLSLRERDHGIAGGSTTLPSCDDDIESALHEVQQLAADEKPATQKVAPETASVVQAASEIFPLEAAAEKSA